ncbi:MAG: hypothetical protein IAE80_01035 [Anaerolinea sp.]|nr:hypothetical protein [Anaerolinea sp.]
MSTLKLVLSVVNVGVRFLLTARTQRAAAGYVTVGGDAVEDFDAMERGLKNHGYPAPEVNGLTMGGGGYAQIGPVIVGGTGEGSGATAEDAYLVGGVGSGGGGAQFGLLLIDWAWLRVYPLVVVGGRGAGASVRPKNNTTQGVSLGTGGVQVVAGVGIELRLPLSTGFQPMIGAHVGWIWNPGDKWVGNLSVDASEMGSRQTSAPYVRMLLGAGTRSTP